MHRPYTNDDLLEHCPYWSECHRSASELCDCGTAIGRAKRRERLSESNDKKNNARKMSETPAPENGATRKLNRNLYKHKKDNAGNKRQAGRCVVKKTVRGRRELDKYWEESRNIPPEGRGDKFLLGEKNVRSQTVRNSRAERSPTWFVYGSQERSVGSTTGRTKRD